MNWWSIFFQAGCPFALNVTFFFGYNLGITPRAGIKDRTCLEYAEKLATKA